MILMVCINHEFRVSPSTLITHTIKSHLHVHALSLYIYVAICCPHVHHAVCACAYCKVYGKDCQRRSHVNSKYSAPKLEPVPELNSSHRVIAGRDLENSLL